MRHPRSSTSMRAEVFAYLCEAACTAAFAAYLNRLKRSYEPHATWVTVMVGVILSAAPAIILGRLEPPPSWRRYEARTLAGFLISGAIIIPWQLWQTAYAIGQGEGYAWSTHDNQTSEVER